MPEWMRSPAYCAAFAVIAFIAAVACFAGLVLPEDLVARIIFGATWALVGVWWTGLSWWARQSAKAGSDRDSRHK
jgi:hypothetical protein